MEAAGQVNGYWCESCGATTYTVNRDEGTTPFTIRCPACSKALARSQFYRVDQSTAATHEWYRPSLQWARQQGRDVFDHVSQGGLMLRAIEGHRDQ